MWRGAATTSGDKKKSAIVEVKQADISVWNTWGPKNTEAQPPIVSSFPPAHVGFAPKGPQQSRRDRKEFYLEEMASRFSRTGPKSTHSSARPFWWTEQNRNRKAKQRNIKRQQKQPKYPPAKSN